MSQRPMSPTSYAPTLQNRQIFQSVMSFGWLFAFVFSLITTTLVAQETTSKTSLLDSIKASSASQASDTPNTPHTPSDTSANMSGINLLNNGFSTAFSQGGTFGGGDASLSVTAEFSPTDANGVATLWIHATPPTGYYTYSLTQPAGGPLRTEISIDPKISGEGWEHVELETLGAFVADPPPEVHSDAMWGDLMIESHASPVTWKIPVRFKNFSSDLELSAGQITGKITSQLCRDGACLPPTEFAFTAKLNDKLDAGTTLPIIDTDTPQSETILNQNATDAITGTADSTTGTSNATSDAEPTSENVVNGRNASNGENMSDTPHSANGVVFDASAVAAHAQSLKSNWTFGSILMIAFLGGLILNLMPCVLPVLGLKVLSFVEQSGESRRRSIVLNLWYTLGILVIFWILALLAILLQMSWGGQFQYAGFTVFMSIFVFAMSLSLLGVWELPIPGFASGRSAATLSRREGVSGAFFKGVITTILATPCSGPYLGTALAWTVSQPAWMILLVFTSMGLGMGTPYLLIGAFPRWAKFLPKPGDWMDTFKQILGFVLLGTVAFLLWTIPEPSFLLPTMILGGCVWFGCWLIQRATDAGRTQWRAWLGMLLLVTIATILGFTGTERWKLPDDLRMRSLQTVLSERYQQTYLAGSSERGDAIGEKRSPLDAHTDVDTNMVDAEASLWRPFTTRAAFETLVNRRQTVLIDFTADWCSTCKALEATVLHTEPVNAKLRENGVIALVGDWTRADPEVDGMLKMLGMRQVPVLAIFPADRPNEPIILADGYTQTLLLDALDRAGPSQQTE